VTDSPVMALPCATLPSPTAQRRAAPPAPLAVTDSAVMALPCAPRSAPLGQRRFLTPARRKPSSFRNASAPCISLLPGLAVVTN
jgi:hypothetical protein